MAEKKLFRIKPLNESFSEFLECPQEKIIELPVNQRCIVNAGPGTGKTYTLIEKIIHMINVADIEPDRILVLCFSRAAIAVIRERLEAAEDEGRLDSTWRKIDIRTFDSFCTYMIALVIEDQPNLFPDYHLEQESYEERIETGISILEKVEGLLDYDHVIIDEVQDLVGCRAKLVLTILQCISDNCGFTVLGDYCQALYDYLADDQKEPYISDDFYEDFFLRFDDTHKFSFTKNHRQSPILARNATFYRRDILTGSDEDRLGDLNRYLKGLESRRLNLNKEDHLQKLLELSENSSVGLLTRNNGQALKLSTLLFSKNIKHILLHPSANDGLAEWIGKTLIPYKDSVINEEIFCDIFSKKYPELESRSYWYSLIETQRDHSKTWIDVSDLLKGISTNAKNPLLYNMESFKESNITVSNIHRSKGREYDNVILAEEMMESDEKNIQEHRICYVAVTRPRKGMFLLDKNKTWFKYSGDDHNRCFVSEKDFRRNIISLREIEFGFTDDISVFSFAYDKTRQALINEIRPGHQLYLIKNDENLFNDTPYLISLDSSGKQIIGETNHHFLNAVEIVLQSMWDRKAPVQYKYFPQKFDHIYVDSITTCVGPYLQRMKGAIRFGSQAIWKGISIAGMARKMSH